MIRFGVTLMVGLVGGLLAKKLRMPGHFMIGSMIAVAIVSIMTGEMAVYHHMKVLAQIISGAYIGQQISKRDLLNLPQLSKAIAGLMTLFTLNMFILGTIFITFFQMDMVTAYLSCLPGGIVDVSLMAIDMGAKPDIVATMQSVRLVGMLLILPLWISFIVNRLAPELRQKRAVALEPAKKVTDSLTSKNQLANDLLILLVSTIAGLVGNAIGIPVGALIFSLLASSVLKIKRATIQMTPNIRYFAQIMAGALIGTSFTHNSLLAMRHLLIPILLMLTSYLLINAFFGYLMFKRKVLDLQSALFASSPAGATDISLLAGELGGDMAKIAGIQISRTMYTVIVMPLLIKIVFYLFS
ncbi:AbrB family transcriptional regulator [Streptococcus porcinus]